MALESPVQRDGDMGFVGFASRLNPLTLPAGMLQDSVNMRLDRGVAQTRKGSKRLTDSIGLTGAPLTLDFTLGADLVVSSIVSSGTDTATVTTASAHGYTTDARVEISGAAAPDDVLYNGDFTITVTGPTTFTYTMTGIPANAATGTLRANNGPEVRETYDGGLYAAGVFASRNYNDANEYIVLVGNDQATLWRQGASADVIGYPSEGVPEFVVGSDTVSVVQAFDRLYILREAERTPNTVWANRLLGVLPGAATISIATPGVVTKTAHGLENDMAVSFTTTGALPTGLTEGTVYYVINKTADTFQVSATSGGAAINTSGSQSGTHTMRPVAAVVSGTTATIFCKNHSYVYGHRVRFENGGQTAFDGHEFDVLNTPAATAHTFAITVPSGTANDLTSSAARVTRRVKPPIYWVGGNTAFVRAPGGIPDAGVSFKSMPSVGWASYINNRLIIPSGRDSLLVSDVLDADTYDPFWQSLRTGAGGDDYIVAVEPWVDGAALVFCRKSIWLVTINQQFDPTNGESLVASINMLTDEIGCSARQSIARAGQFVFFLSDAGVYRLSTQLDLKLRGDTMPLSEPIADLFSTVNQDRVEKSAFAVWHDNRYLIALPTSSDPLDGNQLVLCWNALNERWEYRDTYPSSASVNKIMVATYDNQRRVFSIPRAGNIYLLDEVESAEDDNAPSRGVSPVQGRIKTRRYDFGDMHSKRFMRTVADVVIPAGASVTARITTINPDHEEAVINTLTNPGAGPEDYNMKAPVRYKAHAAEVIYETSGGRPEIRSASIEAAMKSRPATETRNAA